LIDHLTKKSSNLHFKGIGDDMQFDLKTKVVISTDILVEGVHFDLACL
jgi:thiamine monophosphate kinase